MAASPVTHPVKLQILELCHHAFNQDGYRAVSMDMVARQLKISKKTIYKHFNSKEEILEEVLKERLRSIEKKVIKALGNKNSKDDLVHLAELYFEFLASISGQLILEISQFLPHLSDWVDLTEKKAFREPFRKLLKALRKEGLIFYSLGSRELTDSIFVMLKGIKGLAPARRSYIFGLTLEGLNSENATSKSSPDQKSKKTSRKKK